MDFSPTNLLSGFLFSVIGFMVFKQGKKQAQMKSVLLGLTLMFYSMFTPTALWTTVVGCGLCGLAYHFRND